MDSRYWHDQGREVVRERYVEARAKKYRDGGWRGCIVTPTARGMVAVCVELDPRETRRAVEAIRDGHSQLSRAVRSYAQQTAPDTVGWYGTEDIVGDLATLVRPRASALASALRPMLPQQAAPAARGAVDIVGDLGSMLRSFATQAQQAAPAAGAGALTGLVRGLTSGAGLTDAGGALGGAITGAARSLGLPDASDAATALDRVFNPGRYAAADPAAVQGVASGVDAVRAALEAQQQAAAQPKLAPSSVFRSASSALGAEAPVALYSAPGAASQAVSGRLEDAGAALGAEELAQQASALAIPQAAAMIRAALRGVDAAAGAALGDPAARAVLRRAIESESRRARSALMIAQSLLDLR